MPFTAVPRLLGWGGWGLDGVGSRYFTFAAMVLITSCDDVRPFGDGGRALGGKMSSLR